MKTNLHNVPLFYAKLAIATSLTVACSNNNRVSELPELEFGSKSEESALNAGTAASMLQSVSYQKSPMNNSVVGKIQSASFMWGSAGPILLIRGYACQIGFSQPIEVHAYVDGPFGTAGAALAGYAVANRKARDATEDQDAAKACSGAGDAVFYDIKLPYPRWKRLQGKRIFVHGIAIDSAQSGNNLLTGSGEFSIPVENVSP